MALEFDYAKNSPNVHGAKKYHIMLATNRKVNDKTYVHRKCQNQEAQLPEAPKEGDIKIHYENTPIQIYCKFYHQKMKIFRWKILIIFMFLLKT